MKCFWLIQFVTRKWHGLCPVFEFLESVCSMTRPNHIAVGWLLLPGQHGCFLELDVGSKYRLRNISGAVVSAVCFEVAQMKNNFKIFRKTSRLVSVSYRINTRIISKTKSVTSCYWETEQFCWKFVHVNGMHSWHRMSIKMNKLHVTYNTFNVEAEIGMLNMPAKQLFQFVVSDKMQQLSWSLIILMGKKELRYMWIGLNDIEVSTEGFTNVPKASRNFGVAWLMGRCC